MKNALQIANGRYGVIISHDEEVLVLSRKNAIFFLSFVVFTSMIWLDAYHVKLEFSVKKIAPPT